MCINYKIPGVIFAIREEGGIAEFEPSKVLCFAVPTCP